MAKKLFILAYILTFVHFCVGMLMEKEYVYHEQMVVVCQGETLWDIAGRHTSSNEDIRDVVDRIRQHNKLQQALVYPGQVLQVPVQREYHEPYLAVK